MPPLELVPLLLAIPAIAKVGGALIKTWALRRSSSMKVQLRAGDELKIELERPEDVERFLEVLLAEEKLERAEHREGDV